MDDERRAEIMRQAHANLARLHEGFGPVVEVEPEPEPEPARDYLAEALAAPLPDELTEWRCWYAERDAARARAQEELRAQERQTIDAANATSERFEREHELMLDVIARVISLERADMRNHVRASIDALRHELRDMAKGEVIDIPAAPLLFKRKHDAA